MPDSDDKHPLKPEEARAQEAEFFGVTAGFDYDLDGEKWTLPNPSYMDPEMKKRYREHLRAMSEDLDTEKKPHPVTGKPTESQKWPPRIKGELIDEDELLCRALMGDDTYERFLKAGGVPGQVQSRWQYMNRKMQERLMQDPKSN